MRYMDTVIDFKVINRCHIAVEFSMYISGWCLADFHFCLSLLRKLLTLLTQYLTVIVVNIISDIFFKLKSFKYFVVVDVKEPGAEKKSDFYRKYGNPNYEGRRLV